MVSKYQTVQIVWFVEKFLDVLVLGCIHTKQEI